MSSTSSLSHATPTPPSSTRTLRPSPPSRPQETVGTLLTFIAGSLSSALRTLSLADKTHWGPDEYEQVGALEEASASLRRDLAEMAALVGGGLYYENDTRAESLQELGALARRFESHAGVFKEWLRCGGRIEAAWARETVGLGRELGRAMRRAARRVFVGEEEGTESGGRCLGAWVVGRAVRRVREGREEEDQGRAVWQREEEEGRRRGSLESVVPDCNAVGKFERMDLETGDVAFVCDYCDGFIVWPDLESVPSCRSAVGTTTTGGWPNWKALGRSKADGEEKEVVFGPLAIANHMPPRPGEWMARLICEYCEEYTYIDQGDGDGERKWMQDEGGFTSLTAFQEHLLWTHTALPRPALPLPSMGDGKCVVM